MNRTRALELCRNVRAHGEEYQLHTLREFIQLMILRSWEQSGAFDRCAFLGGTALRFLYGLPRFSEDLTFQASRRRAFKRFSEDLDLSLTVGNSEIQTWSDAALRDLQIGGFSVATNLQRDATVQKITFKVSGLMKDAGLSPLAAQTIVVKVELDTRPPAAGAYQHKLLDQPVKVALRCHDLPTLLAGKLHALTMRPYFKGRDWYDLNFYQQISSPQGLQPNLVYLQNAIRQSCERDGSPEWDAATWPARLLDRVQEKKFPKSFAPELQRFLEDPSEADRFDRAFFVNLVQSLQPGVAAQEDQAIPLHRP